MSQWYFVQDGVQAGPVSQGELTELLMRGQIPPNTMVWTEGMSDWVPANTRPELTAPPPQGQMPPVGMPESPIPHMPGVAPVAATLQFAGYAGFWKRVVAAILDGILLFGMSCLLVAPVMGFAIGVGMDPTALEGLANLISIVVAWLYSAGFESSRYQATPGKMALGIVVTDLEGYRIGFGRATGRHFAMILSALILLIGFLMVAFTERKQGLHDIIAGCLVVNKPS